MTTTTEPDHRTLARRGATLTYDVRHPALPPSRRCSSSGHRWAPPGSARSPATSPIARW